MDLILLKRDVYRHLLFNRGTGARMVYDAVGTKSSLPQEKEEDIKGQQKLTERDKEIVRSFLFLQDKGIYRQHVERRQG